MTAPARRTIAAQTHGDAPLRQPTREARRPDIRIEAGRQLRASLWLMLLMGVGLAVTMASRPVAQTDATAEPGKQMVLQLPASATLVATAAPMKATAIR
jgi:hypothetical protein